MKKLGKIFLTYDKQQTNFLKMQSYNQMINNQMKRVQKKNRQKDMKRQSSEKIQTANKNFKRH